MGLKQTVPTLFDVKPKQRSGAFAVAETAAMPTHIVNLRLKVTTPFAQTISTSPQTPIVATATISELLATTPVVSHKELVELEVEKELAGLYDAALAKKLQQEKTLKDTVLATTTAAPPKLTAQPLPVPTTSPTPAPAPPKLYSPLSPELHTLKPPEKLAQFWNPGPRKEIIAVPIVNLSPVAREVEILTGQFKTKIQQQPATTVAAWAMPLQPIKHRRSVPWRIIIMLAALIALGIASYLIIKTSGYTAKQNVLKNSGNAVTNLEQAKLSLEQFDFATAAGRFAIATSDFNKASDTLTTLGASFLTVVEKIPGFQTVRAADSVIEAGRRISQAGENLSRAFADLQKINFLALFSAAGGAPSFSEPLKNFRDVLKSTDDDITLAQQLLADVQTDTIPEDKRQLFEAFKEKIPAFQQYIGDAGTYADFLLKFIGDTGTRTYIVLLENNTELRPTGGFPGTYAILSFQKGALKKVFIDDIYNIDGQIKDNIVPPQPLQHITPNWGMRDANWFADFPTSARKIQEMYQRDGGGAVNGVLAINPSVIARLLDITGPIDMPEYNKTLDSRNFVAEIQEQVEAKTNLSQPKKIVFDFQPVFFQKLAALPKEKWVDVFKVFIDSLTQKHIIASFNDPDLQEVAIENGFAGELKTTDGDYVQVAITNVKGGKADAVTENTMALTTERTTSSFLHTLTIDRTNNGGKSTYAFYNADNPAYIKVYVPDGTQFDGISGNATPNYKPLVSYEDLGFKRDDDLQLIESAMTHPAEAVDLFRESGKMVIGFWIITKQQKTSTVTLSYHVPFSVLRKSSNQYSLIWQKQLGTGSDHIQFSFKKSAGMSIAGHSQELQQVGDNIVLSSDLSIDRDIQIVFN